MSKFLVLNGPNLNLLGTRQPDVYGATTLAEIEAACGALAQDLGITLSWQQSNHEGELIDALHATVGEFDGVIFNAGAFTHTSHALGDAIGSIDTPVIEVHLSNVHTREAFRHTSCLVARCIGQIAGFGPMSYSLAIRAMVDHLEGSD
ncbi:MAG: type II 3-dehydroquinate dehydratase [Pseudomonadota bacterium]